MKDLTLPTPDLQAVRDETIASGQHKDLIRACSLAGLSYADCMRIVAYMPVLSNHEDGGRADDEAFDAELGRIAMRFVDRAGDVHPGIDDAETICAEFSKAMSDAVMKRFPDARGPTSRVAPGGEKGEAVAWRYRVTGINDAPWHFIDHPELAKRIRSTEDEGKPLYEVEPLFAAPVGAEWQPISTAPKDGTPIRLYAQGGGFHDEDFNPSGSVEGHCTDGTWYGAFWDPEHDTWCSREGIVPTHWMPLPKPPVVSSGDGGMNG